MTQPPSADPTLWELHRTLEQLRKDQSDGMKSLRDDLRADLAAMSARFEEMVTKEVYQADQRLVNQRLLAIEEVQREAARAREADQLQAANTRKWLVAVFIAPLLIGVLQLWLSARLGAGP
ncbi:hypothetical protein [Streptomyces sp. NPDC002573]|uniref:hypothetical protein n=1 Tax=Streptomyces sp. NPDC002573 TaxID=3364651 RepID=UPI003696AA01